MGLAFNFGGGIHMKRLVCVFIILGLLIPIGSQAETKKDELDILYNIMEGLDGKCLEVDLVFNGIIFDTFIDGEELKLIGEEVRTKLGIVGKEVDPYIEEEVLEEHYTKEVIFQEDFNQITYIGQDEDLNKIVIILTSYEYDEVKSGETYLYINIMKNSDLIKNNDIIEAVMSIYESFNVAIDKTYCLLGEISNDMSYNNMVKEINKIFARMDVEVVDEFTDGSMISFTAYTPLIEEYIEIGKDRINLNIAIRSSQIDDKTHIWIATPVITVGY